MMVPKMNAGLTMGFASAEANAPSLKLPDSASAREEVARWLLREIGTAVFPGEPRFLSDSFVWHVPVWLSYAGQTQIGVLADIYLNPATGKFIGRPTRDELTRRAELMLSKVA